MAPAVVLITTCACADEMDELQLSAVEADIPLQGESVLGSWVGARRLVPPFLIPHRTPHGFTQDPSTDYYAALQG